MKYKTGNITHTFSMSNISKNHIKEGFYMVLGSLLMAFATAQFLLPNHLSTGGFSGIFTAIYYCLFKIGRKISSKIDNRNFVAIFVFKFTRRICTTNRG